MKIKYNIRKKFVFLVLEYIENKIAGASAPNQGIREIENMEKAMSFIEENIKDATFNILTFATYMRELADEHFDVALVLLCYIMLRVRRSW